ncbi:MAG: hypothetical protein R3266_15970, partial [Gemmatimonadota bacterium]|nr:hypothetical protein [Gemmatimonadota bacterium]
MRPFGEQAVLRRLARGCRLRRGGLLSAPGIAAGPAEPPPLAFYPLLYVAWADGDLSAEELSGLRDAVGGAGLESPAIEAWLDPEAPPSAGALLELLSDIREGAAGLAPEERDSLAGLGLAIAEAGGEAVSSAERLALARLEEALGL